MICSGRRVSLPVFARHRVVERTDLVDDTRTGLPEADSVLGGSGREEVVNLLVDVLGAGQVLLAADLSLNQVVAVDGGRDGDGRETGRHELEEGHLGGRVLASDALITTSILDQHPMRAVAATRGKARTSGRSLR